MIGEDQPHSFNDGDAVSSAWSVLATLDDSALSRFHFKAMLTLGMSFFTDDYDLFIIGVVLAILTPLWHLTPLEVSLVGSTSLIAAALGSVFFGRLADFFGRRSIYGFNIDCAGSRRYCLGLFTRCNIPARFPLHPGSGYRRRLPAQCDSDERIRQPA